MKEDFGKMIRDANYQATQTEWKAPQSLHVVERCHFCNKLFSVSSFQSKLNYEEFIISGLCQRCQDKTAEEGK